MSESNLFCCHTRPPRECVGDALLSQQGSHGKSACAIQMPMNRPQQVRKTSSLPRMRSPNTSPSLCSMTSGFPLMRE